MKKRWGLILALLMVLLVSTVALAADNYFSLNSSNGQYELYVSDQLSGWDYAENVYGSNVYTSFGEDVRVQGFQFNNRWTAGQTFSWTYAYNTSYLDWPAQETPIGYENPDSVTISATGGGVYRVDVSWTLLYNAAGGFQLNHEPSQIGTYNFQEFTGGDNHSMFCVGAAICDPSTSLIFSTAGPGGSLPVKIH